jgi:long-chain acyl-CoA synthetase
MHDMPSEIVDAFTRIRRNNPEQPLIYLPATDAIVTATMLWDASERLGLALDRGRVNPRSLLVAAVGNRPAFLALFLCCRRRGQPLLPLDGATTAAEVASTASHFGAAAIVTASEQPLTGYGERTPLEMALTLARADRDPGDSRHGDAAILKMTSGSSGVPRATRTTESALVADSSTLMPAMDVRDGDVQIAAIPLSHSYGLGNLVGPLFLFATPLVLRDAFVPQRLPDDARRYGARAFPGVPFMFDHFASHPPPGGWPPTLSRLISAGAPLEADLAERFRALFGVKVHPFYGTSETGGITYDATGNAARDGMVGTALPGVTIRLVPHDHAPAGGGRVVVASAAVSRGYADGVDAGAFVDGRFVTGDLGVIDDAGALTLTGRVSAFVNVAGRKVQPDEVERVLRSCEAVRDARVLGFADERRGEQLVACVVAAGARPTIVQLRQYCGTRLASHKIPRAFVFVDEIPLTERGKTDRTRLQAIVAAALKRPNGVL